LNHRMSKIERKLEIREPLFVWERVRHTGRRTNGRRTRCRS
jgi:hypothetical protein